MMNKREKLIMLVVTSMLTILGIYICIIDSPKKDGISYNISIIYRDASDSFKLGVEQGAEDYNVDIHLISAYELEQSMQQKEYIEREVKNGAQAIILSADDESIYEQAVEDLMGVAVIAIGEPAKTPYVNCYVGVDNYEIGERLGKLTSGEDKNMRCVVLCPLTAKICINERLEGVRRVLQEQGRKYDIIYCGSEGTEIGAEVKGTDTCILIALDKCLLRGMCKAARDEDVLLGEGYTAAIRTQLETGRIQGIVVYSEFNEGYLSVQAAVQAIENKGRAEGCILHLYEITNKSMYEQPGEKILFPVK